MLLTTLQSSEMVGSERQKPFWHPSIAMLPAACTTCSRALSAQGSLVSSLALVVTALWLGSWLACEQRQPRLALWCIGLCGGLATSVVLSTWSDFRSVVYGFSP